MTLNRRTTVATATVIAVIAVPIVWVVGYQSHPWREPQLAIAAGVALIGAAVAVLIAGSQEDPPVSYVLTLTANVVAVGALLSALFWASFD